MTVYSERWYLEVVCPQARSWSDGVNSFVYEDKGHECASPYGYPGIDGDASVVRTALGKPLFIRYRVDQRMGMAHAKEKQTRVVPLDSPWLPGDPQVVEAARAKRLGVTAAYDGAGRGVLKAFRQHYDEAMREKSAADKYHTIAERLELWADNPKVHVFTALGAGAMFLSDGEWAHYHLSFRSRLAHNTAMHAIFEVAANTLRGFGHKRIHLGGGLTDAPDDPLYKFKARIGRTPWTIYQQEIP